MSGYPLTSLNQVTETLDLPFWQVAARQTLSRHEIAGGEWKLTAFLEHAMDALVMQISGLLASHPVEDVHISYPSDWWEAFRERWAPTWVKRKWPIRYIEHSYEARFVFPDMQFPKACGRSVKVVSYNKLTTRSPYDDD